MLNKHTQQVVFLRRQLHLAVANLDDAAYQIDRQIAGSKHRTLAMNLQLMPQREDHLDGLVSLAHGQGEVDTGGLLPSKDGVRVRLANGKIVVTDGPFTESKEVIGGWAILETASRDEAVRIATEFMELHRKHWPEFDGESEVRPMFDPGVGP